MQTWLTGSLPITDFGGSRITNVAAPQAANDVVTLGYLNSIPLVQQIEHGVGTATSSTPPTSSSLLFYVGTDVQNSGSAETDLYSETIPGHTLTTIPFVAIQARFAGNFINTASTKRLRVYFGGTQIMEGGNTTTTDLAAWDVSVLIVKPFGIPNTSARCTTRMNIYGISDYNAFANYATVTSLNFSNPLILKITGTAAGTSPATGDIIAKMGIGYTTK